MSGDERLRLVATAARPTGALATYFRALAAEPALDLRVWYAVGKGVEDWTEGHGRSPDRPVTLLEGYAWRELEPPRRESRQRGTLRRLLAAEGAHAVLSTGWRLGVLIDAARVARRIGLPAVLRTEAAESTPPGFWRRLRLRRRLARFDGVLAGGAASRRFFAACGVEPARLFEAPYAVDSSRFVDAAARLRPHRAELRRRHGLADDAFGLVFAGELSAARRPLELLAALEVARREQPQLRLLVLGDGPLEAEARAHASERRLPVTFFGRQEEAGVCEAFAVADALALPAEGQESWGAVVHQAMASGLPAVLSDAALCREDLIEEGVTGFSYPAGDPRAFAACITSLAADPIRAAAMGEAACTRVLERFSPALAAAGTLAAVRELLERRRR